VSKRSTLIRSTLAVAIGLGAIGLRLILGSVLGRSSPYTVLYLAVTLSGWLLGFGPSVVTLAVCDIFATIYLLPPHFSLAVAEGYRVGLVLFNLEGLAICAIIASLHLTRNKLERAIEEAAEHSKRAEILRQEAERANSAKDQFLAMVSHELRNPLTSLALMPPLLRSGLEPRFQAERVAKIVEASTLALTRMVEDLVDSARIVSGQLRLNMRALDLVEVIDGAIELMRAAAEAKGLELSRSIAPATAHMNGDADRLREAICNLIGNAIKFTTAGGVNVGLQVDERAIEIAVSDSGEGIEPDLLPRIFDRFVQGHHSDKRKGGLGLGLFIVKHVVELHGGVVNAYSVGKGQGTRFVVRLPNDQDDSKPRKIMPSSGTAEAAG
jgi:signal transduction histidine kinase